MTTIKNCITNFFQCEPLTILNQLYTEYGTITSSDLTEIFDCMTAHWNPPTPIAENFQQINDRNEFSEEGNERINDSQLLCLCYNNVHASGIFNETLKNWHKKTDINKTYAKFVPLMTQ